LLKLRVLSLLWLANRCQMMPSVLWRCWLRSRKGIRPVEWWDAGMVICLERGADLHTAQLMPLPLTVSCFSKIQIGFIFLVPAPPGRPGKRAVKRVCVCVCVYQVMSVVHWKLTVQFQNDCYFVLGWWVQCYVLCQQWYCACWSWWNTQSYEACCCTGNTQRGSVSCTFRKFGGIRNAWCLQSKVKAHFSCDSVSYSRHIFQIITNATGSCSSYNMEMFQ